MIIEQNSKLSNFRTRIMPKSPRLVLILFVLVFLSSCRNKTIVGQWRSDQGDETPSSWFKMTLLLTIRSDSTTTWDFGPDSSSSTLPGWHSIGKQNGTWKNLDDNKVEFVIVYGTKKYPFVYKIAKLNDDSLILQSPFDFLLKFKRLD